MRCCSRRAAGTRESARGSLSRLRVSCLRRACGQLGASFFSNRASASSAATIEAEVAAEIAAVDATEGAMVSPTYGGARLRSATKVRQSAICV